FYQAEDGIRDFHVTGVQTCALPISGGKDEAVELVPYRTIPELLADVQAGRLDKGVVPIENSIEGSVAVTLDVLVHEVDLQINGEVVLPIRHHLIAKPGVAVNEIQERSEE